MLTCYSFLGVPRVNIFVCLKQVPDTETKLKISADGGAIDTSNIKWIINPYDEFAIEEAIKLKEAGGGSVTVFTVGPAKRCVEALRTALAMGADNATLVDAPEFVDSLSTAKALAAAIRQEGAFDLILTGKLAIDDNAAAVGPMLAELLQIPHTMVVSKLNRQDAELAVERDIEGGARELVNLKLPALIGANKGLNMPRYASLPGIMKAKKKTVKELSLSGLGLPTEGSAMIYNNFSLPPERPPARMLEGDAAAQAGQLARLLREDAKVI